MQILSKVLAFLWGYDLILSLTEHTNESIANLRSQGLW